MKKIIFTLLAYFPAICFAQVAHEEMKRNLFMNPLSSVQQNHIRTINGMEFDDNLMKYFIFSAWNVMEATGIEEEQMTVDSANFLIKESKILFVKGGEIFQVFPSNVKSVKLGNKEFVPYESMEEGRIGTKEFYELLSDGEVRLLKSWKLVEKKVSNSPLGISENNKVEIIKRSELYYLNARDEITSVPRKKVDILKLFGKNKTKVINYASNNNLSLKREKDLIDLFDYYNSINENDEF